ncbi:MAG TPA: PTS transporter subunit EIIC [Candidatus Baltobacteraceae bacterium]|nr:PTS transporter subunit EIIC [Candidatus Baltobacteraceae bacterium]
MSRSSVASRPSSAGSSPFGALRAIAELAFLAATRDALPWSFGGLLAAFFAILPSVSVPGPFIGPSLGLRVSAALLPAFGIMGLVLAPTLAWFYARRAHIDTTAAIAGATLGYLLALPSYSGALLPYLRSVGPSGLFLALGACGAVALGARLARTAWIGALLTVALALALRALHVDLAAAVAQMLEPLGRLGDTYAALVVIVLVQTLLWTIGIHGPALLAAVVTPVYLTLQMQNTLAYDHHLSLPHIVVVSLFLFIFPGGAGSTLPLAALLVFSRVPRLRTVGRATIVPAVFNANEPLLFAVPVVLNPFLVPPFIVAPLLLATTTYFAVAWGWVGRPIYYVPSSVPTLISTYLSTLDVRAIALVLINVALATAAYLPFVRAYERHLQHEALEAAA